MISEVCTNFRRRLLQRGEEPELSLAKLGYYSHYASSSLRYLKMCGHMEYVLF